MKVIICLVFSFLAVYAASANDDDITSEKLEKVFTNIFLMRGKNRYENRTVHEKDERVINLKKDNVDVTIFMRERKMYTRKVLMNATSELKGNTFSVNATAIYLDAQDDGIIHVNGTVDQNPVNETGRMSINWKRLRESAVVKRADFNETDITVHEIVPENEWSVPTIKLSGAEVLAKHVTEEDLVRALNVEMERKMKMQQASFADLDSDTIPRSYFQGAYKKLVC